MDGGFKRLWSRKKSAGASDRSTHQRNVSARSGMTTKSQAVSSGRPSLATSQSDRPNFRDRLAGTKDYLSSPSGDESARPKTVGRIQPMLVGISRPDTGMERPETAGSFQNAVLRAADSVHPQLGDGSGEQPPAIPPKHKERSSRPSDVSGTRSPSQPTSHPPSQPISKPVSKSASKPVSKPVSIRSQQKDKPSRHVDIFSVATSVPSPLSRYNEEIAERNLDTLRLALENTPYVYNPSSRYQEEVAIRNATLPYKSRTSTDTIPHVTDAGRTASMTNRSTRNVASPRPRSSHSYTQSQPQPHSHSHQPSNASVEPIQKISRERPAQHTRQISQRSQEAPRLSVIPQEEAHESMVSERSHTEDPLHNTYQGLQVMPSVPAYNDEFEGLEEEPSYEIVPAPSATVTGPFTSNFTTPEVQASTSDYGMRPLHLPATGRITEQKTYHDPIFNPAPRNLVPLPKRLEGRHRTFIDLTDEEADQVSEASSPYPASQYSAYSPIVEQAGFDAVQRVLPSQIHTEERRNSKMIDSSTIPSSVHVDPATTPKAQTPRIQTPKKQTPQRQSPRLATAPLSYSAFSPINTVASWSPRSSLATHSGAPAEPTSMTARVTALLEANKAGNKENALPGSQKRGDETPTVKERVATFESNSDRGISPATSLTNLSSDNGKSKAQSSAILFSRAALAPSTDIEAPSPSVAVAKTQAENIGNTSAPSIPTASPPQKSSRPAVRNSSTSSAVRTSTVKATPKTTSTPSIYTSPESIKSADYINPSNAFGVRTRDFAIAPLKETQSSIEVPTVKQFSKQPAPSRKGKSVKARTTQNTPAPLKSKDTGFDEEAFARKRAEAQAAIERLKESLNENFMTLPERVPVKNRTIVEEEPEPEPEPEPELEPTLAAPVVPISPEQRTSIGVPAIQRPESEKPPPSSYRNSRGEPNRTSLASSSRSLSNGSKSSRRAPAPSSLKNVEPAAHPIDQKLLSPALLQALSIGSTAPKSPGEISLSSFPVPSSSRPPSQPDAISGYHSHHSSFAAPYPQYSYTASHSHHNSFAGAVKRRNSTKSQISNISAFSIPFHMVPGRTSSVKDPLPEEGDIW